MAGPRADSAALTPTASRCPRGPGGLRPGRRAETPEAVEGRLRDVVCQATPGMPRAWNAARTASAALLPYILCAVATVVFAAAAKLVSGAKPN